MCHIPIFFIFFISTEKLWYMQYFLIFELVNISDNHDKNLMQYNVFKVNSKIIYWILGLFQIINISWKLWNDTKIDFYILYFIYFFNYSAYAQCVILYFLYVFHLHRKMTIFLTFDLLNMSKKKIDLKNIS